MKTNNIKQNIKLNNIIANKSTKKRNPLWKENKQKKSMCKIIFIKKILKGQKLIVKKKAKKNTKKSLQSLENSCYKWQKKKKKSGKVRYKNLFEEKKEKH